MGITECGLEARRTWQRAHAAYVAGIADGWGPSPYGRGAADAAKVIADAVATATAAERKRAADRLHERADEAVRSARPALADALRDEAVRLMEEG